MTCRSGSISRAKPPGSTAQQVRRRALAEGFSPWEASKIKDALANLVKGDWISRRDKTYWRCETDPKPPLRKWALSDLEIENIVRRLISCETSASVAESLGHPRHVVDYYRKRNGLVVSQPDRRKRMRRLRRRARRMRTGGWFPVDIAAVLFVSGYTVRTWVRTSRSLSIASRLRRHQWTMREIARRSGAPVSRVARVWKAIGNGERYRIIPEAVRSP